MQDSKNNIQETLPHSNEEIKKDKEQTQEHSHNDIINLTESSNETAINTLESHDIYDYRQETKIQHISTETAKLHSNVNDGMQTAILDNETPPIDKDISSDTTLDSNQPAKDTLPHDSQDSNQTSEIIDDTPAISVNDNLATMQQNNIDTHTTIQSNTLESNITQQSDKESPFLQDTKPSKKRKKEKKHKKAKKQKYNWNYIVYSKRIFVGTALAACFIGLYAGYLFFGSTSFGVLWNLHQTRNALRIDVEQSRLENATLQRKVLELKALEPK